MGWRTGWVAAFLIVVSIVPDVPCQTGTTAREPQWRRTRFGWVHVNELFPPDRPNPPPLHPLVIAAGQALLSIGTLLALQDSDEKRTTEGRTTKDAMNAEEYDSRG